MEPSSYHRALLNNTRDRMKMHDYDDDDDIVTIMMITLINADCHDDDDEIQAHFATVAKPGDVSSCKN